MATRKLGNLAKPTVTITISGDSFVLKSESTFRNLETKCTIGVEWDEETPDGRKCKVSKKKTILLFSFPITKRNGDAFKSILG